MQDHRVLGPAPLPDTRVAHGHHVEGAVEEIDAAVHEDDVHGRLVVRGAPVGGLFQRPSEVLGSEPGHVHDHNARVEVGEAGGWIQVLHARPAREGRPDGPVAPGHPGRDGPGHAHPVEGADVTFHDGVHVEPEDPLDLAREHLVQVEAGEHGGAAEPQVPPAAHPAPGRVQHRARVETQLLHRIDLHAQISWGEVFHLLGEAAQHRIGPAHVLLRDHHVHRQALLARHVPRERVQAVQEARETVGRGRVRDVDGWQTLSRLLLHLRTHAGSRRGIRGVLSLLGAHRVLRGG
mmetsp:Transcript_25334/g.67609  ORF Transcript_25334/g.67609 Transcript_25334/m.67609 type:complete len:292 (+) Transcript_25334:299-1174(+)